jgi:hypothetical protein
MLRIQRVALVGVVAAALISGALTAERLGPRIQSSGYKITERNSTWARFAWKAVIFNGDDVPYRFRIVVEFTDRDGYTVASDTEYDQRLKAFEQREFTGDKLISFPAADTVYSARVKLQDP